MAEKIFPKGFYPKKRDGAPDFVLTSISIKVPEAVPFLESMQNNAGYVNLDLLSGNNGPYLVVNTYKPTAKEEVEPKVEEDEPETIEYPQDEISSEDIPF